MTIRRSAAAVGAVTLGLLSLSACSKPTPQATVTVGGSSVTAEAACYNPDGKQLSDVRSCLAKAPAQTISVHSFDKVRVGVDPAIADQGWEAIANNQAVTNPSKTSYLTVSTGDKLLQDQTTGQTMKSTVLIVAEGAKTGNGVSGIWTFKVDSAD